jgi:uncharacterized protein (TIGR00369 family)
MSLAMELSGLDTIKAIFAGELPPPPIAELMGFRGVEAEPGRAVFEMTPGQQHYNPIGSVHGGIAATLLDSSLGCAVHTTLDAGVGYTTSDLQVRYVRAIGAQTGRVLADSSVVHSGRRLATAEGRLYVESSGQLLAHASTSCLILGA